MKLRQSSDSAEGDMPGSARQGKLQRALAEENIDLAAVRRLAWGGLQPEIRAVAWKLLLGYLPTNRDRRAATLERKRKEYADYLPKYCDVGDAGRTEEERA